MIESCRANTSREKIRLRSDSRLAHGELIVFPVVQATKAAIKRVIRFKSNYVGRFQFVLDWNDRATVNLGTLTIPLTRATLAGSARLVQSRADEFGQVLNRHRTLFEHRFVVTAEIEIVAQFPFNPLA